MQAITRFCEVCLKEVPLTDFSIHKKTGPALHCNKCQAVLSKLYRQDPKKYYEELLARRQARKARREAGIVEKACSKCGVVKALSEFRTHGRGICGKNGQCKECERKWNNEHNAQHRDEINTKQRKAWKEKPQTPEQKAQARQRASVWYYANKERAAESNRVWVRNNPEKFKASQKKYLIKNPVHIRRKAYMDKIVKDLTAAQWQEILEVFGYRCAYCLRQTVPLTMDHIQPVSKGGPHTASNIVPACKSCNSVKNDRLIFTMLNRKCG